MNINGVNGFLSYIANHRKTAAKELSGRIIDKRDADGDGRLSMKELGKAADKLRKSDTDNDGYISRNELLASMTERVNAQKSSHGVDVDSLSSLKSAIGRLQSAGQNLPSAESLTDNIFAHKDSDQDGLLSKEELGKRADMFSFADTDGDGYISSEESISAINNKQESLNSLNGYARKNGSSLQELLMDKLDISEKEAEKLISLLENSSFRLRA